MPLSTNAAMRKDATTAARLEHRHFAFIAQTISALPDPRERYAVAYHFAIACRSTNGKFDHGRFMRACNAISVTCQAPIAQGPMEGESYTQYRIRSGLASRLSYLTEKW